MVGDRRQAGNLGKQASKADQEQAGSITGRQAGNQRWNDSYVAEHNLAQNESKSRA